MPLPRARDVHKLDKRKVPNCLGLVYAFASVVYLFVLYSLGVNGSLVLGATILFGSFMGVIDDFMDLRWRVKAFFPLVASLPLIAFRAGNPLMNLPFLGNINFGVLFYIAVIPLMVTVVTNSVNMLGGLNGISTICPGTVMFGLFIASIINGVKFVQLLIMPLICLGILSYFTFRGKVFFGNVGSFAVGTSIVCYAIMANLERALLISILPFIFNSVLILTNMVLLKRRPKLLLKKDGTLYAKHSRSLVTLLAKGNPNVKTEKKLVLTIACLFVISTIVGVVLAS